MPLVLFFAEQPQIISGKMYNVKSTPVNNNVPMIKEKAIDTITLGITITYPNLFILFVENALL
jgi:hypothetical protein